jgi:hypothetical protein
MAQAETIPNTTRRGFLSGAVAATVLPATALAGSTDDPILAIVERCRAAFNEFGAASLACDEVAAERRGHPITEADRDRIEAASDELDEATGQLVSMAPTTMAGLAAAVMWLMEYDAGCIPDTSGRFLRTLATSPLIVGG